MIAPKVISHVGPVAYDYSTNTSPDIITAVPVFALQEGAKVRVTDLELSTVGLTGRILRFDATVAPRGAWVVAHDNPQPASRGHRTVPPVAVYYTSEIEVL